MFILAFLAVATSAQFIKAPVYNQTIKSTLNPAITVQYNSPGSDTCATAFDAQKQYSGYIQLPPYTLAPIQQNYSINTFFWFVEARTNASTAPLTIWLNGGPGASSMFGFFQETGPCTVVEGQNGTYDTLPNLYGWDRSSNIIFIDQPAQVGLSYDTATNGSLDLMTADITYPPTSPPDGQPAYTFLNGTFSSGQSYATANTTRIAAQATWHFLQTWLAAFPQYNPGVRPENDSVVDPTGVHLFAESYGGQYGPVFASFFQQQNAARANGTLSPNTLEISLQSLGILNGLVDTLIQAYYSPLFAYNNTYGVKAVSELDQLNALQDYSAQCLPAINDCRAAIATTDPDADGDVAVTDAKCQQASLTCNAFQQTFQESGLDPYDIRFQVPSDASSAAYVEYLNTARVQVAIGAGVNYTDSNPLIQDVFLSTGDFVRGDAINDLAGLLRAGVKVALIYGDADWVCNWLGGEAVSLALAGLLPDHPANASTVLNASSAPLPSPSVAVPPTSHNPSGLAGSYAAQFPRAGYADIVVNSTYVGGAVRQFGNLSFSRVYDSGHFVPYYQPETAFTLFTRIILGTDLSTGAAITNMSSFSSSGPLNATKTQSAPSQDDTPDPVCWIRDIPNTCPSSAVASMSKNQGIVIAGVWYANKADYTPPTSTAIMDSVARPMTSGSMGGATGATGVYTATATPSPTGGAGCMRPEYAFVAAAAGVVVSGLLA